MQVVKVKKEPKRNVIKQKFITTNYLKKRAIFDKDLEFEVSTENENEDERKVVLHKHIFCYEAIEINKSQSGVEEDKQQQKEELQRHGTSCASRCGTTNFIV